MLSNERFYLPVGSVSGGAGDSGHAYVGELLAVDWHDRPLNGVLRIYIDGGYRFISTAIALPIMVSTLGSTSTSVRIIRPLSPYH